MAVTTAACGCKPKSAPLLSSRGQPYSPDTTLLSGHLLSWRDLVHLHHPLVLPPPSLIKPRSHSEKSVPTRSSANLTGRSCVQQSPRDLLRHYSQPPALQRKNCGTIAALFPMLCVPSPRRDQRYTDHPLDPAIQLLNWDIHQHLRKVKPDQWRILQDSSGRATNQRHYLSLLCKLSGKR